MPGNGDAWTTGPALATPPSPSPGRRRELPRGVGLRPASSPSRPLSRRSASELVGRVLRGERAASRKGFAGRFPTYLLVPQARPQIGPVHPQPDADLHSSGAWPVEDVQSPGARTRRPPGRPGRHGRVAHRAGGVAVHAHRRHRGRQLDRSRRDLGRCRRALRRAGRAAASARRRRSRGRGTPRGRPRGRPSTAWSSSSSRHAQHRQRPGAGSTAAACSSSSSTRW